MTLKTTSTSSESGYLSEDVLQQLLAQHPNLLSGSQITPNKPRRWLLVSREFGVPDAERSGNRWSLDHLFLDQDGIPTLVEVKRSTDTRIIEFLNEQMRSAEILGVEIKQFTGKTMKTLVPRVIGLTSEAQNAKASASVSSGITWDETSFIEALGLTCTEADASTMRRLIEGLRKQTDYFWFGSGKRGSLCPVLKTPKGNRYILWLWTSGHIEIAFQYLKGQPPFEDEVMRMKLLEQLNTIKGVRIPVERVNLRPSIMVSLLVEQSALEQFLEIMDWFWTEVKLAAKI